MTTPHAAAAGAARQRLADVLGKLQQDPNCPPAVLEILSGLARAMGPLFQLERGSADLQLFGTARGVLQETLEKIQQADQRYPGVAEATGAVAQALGEIFKAMKEAGLVNPGAGQPAQPAAPNPAPAQQPSATAMAATQISPQTFGAGQPAQPHAAAQPAQPFGGAQPVPLQQPAAQAFPLQPKPTPAPAPAMKAPTAPAAPAQAGSAFRAPTGSSMAATVPTGPNGLPRLESEVGVHSETNFFTDFLGDINNHGGIFVATFHVLPIGTKCEVSLTFPGNLTADIRGVVRWKRENAPGASSTASPGLGVEITDADKNAWDLIHRFIRKREPIMHEM